MSVSKLLRAAQLKQEPRMEALLPSPWNMETKVWNAAALQAAKELVDQWEEFYPEFKKRVRHLKPNEKPQIPTFKKVPDDLIAPMIALGGKSKYIKFFVTLGI